MAAYRKRMIPPTLLSDEKSNNFSSSESLGLGKLNKIKLNLSALNIKTIYASRKQYLFNPFLVK